MKAGVKQIMAFFGYVSNASFMADWRALSDEDKEWFKIEVGKAIS